MSLRGRRLSLARRLRSARTSRVSGKLPVSGQRSMALPDGTLVSGQDEFVELHADLPNWLWQGRTALALVLLCSASAMATEAETLPTGPSVNVPPSTLAAAKQLQVDIRRINSKLTDPRKQRFTDVSKAVEKCIPIGSTIDDAEALMMAMGCKPPLRLGVGESPPHGYRRPPCTSTGVTANPDKSQSVGALVELPGRFLEGHFLSIHAQTTRADRRIISVQATIDIRTPGDL
jgi:hypothetical protein